MATGRWGGTGIVMVVGEKGAALDFACAHGTIEQPLVADRRGRLEATGAYVGEHRGPAREGDEERSRPARFTGRLDGRKLTLTILLEQPAETLGPYALEYGKTPRLVKCQ